MTSRETYFPRHDAIDACFKPSYKELRQLFEEVRRVPGEREADLSVVRHVLSNGMTVGQFSTWYLVHCILPTRR